ncbi:MAG: amidohydrolase family protein [Planctomycetota bacterium]|nr:amidohydrolase family protein [Planctomycetota bacterium]
MIWIDACCHSGSDRNPGGEGGPESPRIAELLREMDRLSIAQALVTGAWSDHIASDHANLQLFDDLAPHAKRLLPVPEVTPEGGELFLDRPADAIIDFTRRGAAAGVARLRKNGYLLVPWCSGAMLAAMQDRRLPLMVTLGEVDPNHLHDVLRDFPKLPVIMQGLPRMGFHRVVYPLLGLFPNLHVVLAVPHSVHLGIDYLVQRFGARQFLFGTNFPRSEPGAGIVGVMYAGISDEAKSLIAGGNAQRLLNEVRRD